MSKKIKSILLAAGAVLLALGGYTTAIILRPSEDGGIEADVQTNIELSEEQVPTIIEDENGEEQIIDAATVEAVDSEIVTECPEGEEECGQGAYVYAPTETYTAFRDYVYGSCWDVDHFAGSQCWDEGALFWMNYTNDGRTLSTCGTGAAKGAWACKEQNAGDEFELIYDATQIQPGDWLIFTNGKYGHVGMALGNYNNGYVALLGTNQGGSPCPGGGAAANIINMSLKTFAGAFRPKTYITVEPTPEPAPIGDGVVYTYKKGDNFGNVLLKNGLATTKNLWGPNGKVAEYNKQLEAQGLVVYYNNKYWGNIPIGTTITLK